MLALLCVALAMPSGAGGYAIQATNTQGPQVQAIAGAGPWVFQRADGSMAR